MRPATRLSIVRYAVETPRAGWELEEGMMPASFLHSSVVDTLRDVLAAWAARSAEPMVVARSVAIRWIESRPAVGVDPDVCVLSPPPPDVENVRSVRTWIEGHTPPILAIEVVSTTNPLKDYTIAPDKYAASGTYELVVFDPLLTGPTAHGGPFPLQVWRRSDDDDFVRVYAGDGPVRATTLDAWLVVAADGRSVCIANDPNGVIRWLTAEEAERAAKEAERAAKEAERAAKEAAIAAERAAMARVAELEAELARRR